MYAIADEGDSGSKREREIEAKASTDCCLQNIKEHADALEAEGHAETPLAAIVKSVFGKGDFATDDELRQWLDDHSVSTSTWGADATKTIGDLRDELDRAESTLHVEEGRVLRCLSVAKVRVLRLGSSDRKQLFEAKQQLPTGGVRVRGVPLSEKMFAGEEPREAALRGVREELATKLADPAGDVQFIGPLHEFVEVKMSPSYPKLVCRYGFPPARVQCSDAAARMTVE